MALITLAGLTDNDKVPSPYSDNQFGQGRNAASLGAEVVITGNVTSGASLTPDLDVSQIFGYTDAATKLGARSEAMQQYLEAQDTGADIYAAPVAEASGAVAATVVINFEALGSGTGSFKVLFGEHTVDVSVDTSSASNTADNTVAAVNAKTNGFCLATKGGASEYDVTLTVVSKGIRGNDYLCKLDTTDAPTGFIATVGPTQDIDAIKTSIATVAAPASYSGAQLDGAIGTGAISPSRQITATSSVSAGAYVAGSVITITGTTEEVGAADTDTMTVVGTGGGESLATTKHFSAVTQIDIEAQAQVTGSWQFGTYSEAYQTTSGWTNFYGGTGTDDATNVIAALEAAEYSRIAPAQNDATNAALWEAHADSESAPLIDHKEQIVFGHNGTLTAVTSLAQTTLNAYLCGVYAQRNSRKHPCQIAARVAALRAAAESTNPWTRYDGIYNDTAAQLWTTVAAHSADRWSHAELKSLLNAGVSPVNDFNGDTRIVRSICSHSLNGTDPDYRCLDTADVTVPQYVRARCTTLATTYLEENPGVGDDLPDGAPQIAGVGTPSIWNALVLGDLKEVEALGYIKDVDTNPPISEYDDDTDRINTIVPTVVRKHQHILAQSIRQIDG